MRSLSNGSWAGIGILALIAVVSAMCALSGCAEPGDKNEKHYTNVSESAPGWNELDVVGEVPAPFTGGYELRANALGCEFYYAGRRAKMHARIGSDRTKYTAVRSTDGHKVVGEALPVGLSDNGNSDSLGRAILDKCIDRLPGYVRRFVGFEPGASRLPAPPDNIVWVWWISQDGRYDIHYGFMAADSVNCRISLDEESGDGFVGAFSDEGFHHFEMRGGRRVHEDPSEAVCPDCVENRAKRCLQLAGNEVLSFLENRN